MRPQKHSLTLHGHRTSVSLEPEFWQAFQDLAKEKGIALNALAAEVDGIRSETGDIDRGLASAIRVYILNELTQKLR